MMTDRWKAKTAETQDLVRRLYSERGYTGDLPTLALGVCEEAGEVAKAVNAHHNPEYKLSAHSRSDTLEHELVDLLIYAYGLANAAGIRLDNAVRASLADDLYF